MDCFISLYGNEMHGKFLKKSNQFILSYSNLRQLNEWIVENTSLLKAVQWYVPKFGAFK